MTNDHEHRAILAAIIDSSEDAIISKDLNSRVTSWNKAAERMFGYTEEEMIGQPIHLLIPEGRKHEEEMILSKLKKGIRIEHFETVRTTKDHRLLNISLTISPIHDRDGKIIGASKIARDITKQKQDEQVIRDYANRMELLNSISKNISSKLEVSSILQKVTDTTTKLAGASLGAFFYNKVDASGESYMLYALSGASREVFDRMGMPRNTAIFSTTFDGLGTVRSDDITEDYRYGKNKPHRGMPEGHPKVVSYLAVPVISQASGVVIGGLFFGHPQRARFTEDHANLVEAVASQAAITLDNAKLYEEVKILSSKKDEFIGFASHELKTPLTTISGYVQLARMLPQLPPDFFDKLSRQVERLDGIITDLLDVTKIQAAKLEFRPEPVYLKKLLKHSLEAIHTNTHKIIWEEPPGEIMVVVDEKKMIQVITNILTNAIKYSAPGTKVIMDSTLIGDQVTISIKDEGLGIPAADLKNIFNQFYRIQKNVGNREGLGLGLFISKEIIEMHKGRIWAESEEKKGSVFYISFPLERINN